MENEHEQEGRRLRRREREEGEYEEEASSDEEESEEEEDSEEMGLLEFNGEAETALAVVEAEQAVKEAKKAHEQHVNMASLSLNARLAWNGLPANARRNLSIIRLCLTQPLEKIPECMHWGEFDQSSSNDLCDNKKCLLARLSSEAPGFEELYSNEHFNVPKKLRG